MLALFRDVFAFHKAGETYKTRDITDFDNSDCFVIALYVVFSLVPRLDTPNAEVTGAPHHETNKER